MTAVLATLVPALPATATTSGRAAAPTGDSVTQPLGRSLATVDLDGDGRDERILGKPAVRGGRGEVRIRWTGAGPQAVRHDTPRRGDRFGAAVAVGDFDGDGRRDLAVGAPGRNVAGARGAGSVTIHYGGTRGFSRTEELDLRATRLPSTARSAFGAAVVAGDVDGDGIDDLVVGVPGATVAGARKAGAVVVFAGSTRGLRSTTVLDQGAGVTGSPGRNDRFGAALAIGDRDGDGRADLAVGAPGEDVRGRHNAGIVHVFSGRPGGLSTSDRWSTASLGRRAAARGDRLGVALGSADVDDDGLVDFLIASRRTTTARAGSGVAIVVRGDRRGVRPANIEILASAPTRPRPSSGGAVAGTGDQPEWLARLNTMRAIAGLAPVTEDPSLSRPAAAHAQWMVRNDTVAHAQTPGTPGYSSAGHEAAQNSVVLGTSASTMSATSTIDHWITGPFHAFTLLDPRLERVGYGSAADDACGNTSSYCVRSAAALDIFRGRTGEEATRAFAWPGDGTTVPLDQQLGTEWPDPGTSCPPTARDRERAEGLPIMVFFTEDVRRPQISFTTGDGGSVGHCSFHAGSYRNPDEYSQEYGNDSLARYRAVVIMPDDRLTFGTEYCYRVRSGTETVRGCFTPTAD